MKSTAGFHVPFKKQLQLPEIINRSKVVGPKQDLSLPSCSKNPKQKSKSKKIGKG